MPPVAPACIGSPPQPTAAMRTESSVRVTRSGWPRSFLAWTMAMLPVPKPSKPQAETRSLSVNRAYLLRRGRIIVEPAGS